MSGSHLSIGEVLSLLQGEFPDITISKIRFLEAQGLIDPERTPSGYRKFYDADLTRLRWILTEQRDSFLPLKVIKDRLVAEGGLGPSARPSDPVDPGARGEVPTSLSAVPPLADGGDRAGDDRTVAVASAPVGPSGDGVSPGGTAASLVAAPASSEASSDGHLAGLATGDGAAAGPAGSGDLPVPADVSAPTGFEGWSPPRLGRAAARREANGGADGRARAPRSGERSGRVRGSANPLHRGDLGEVSLTQAELAAAAGLDLSRLRDLERFGLVVGRRVGPDTIYDGDDLIVARLAARLAAHGIDARHLRQFRVAADNELALFSQVINPVQRQRDSASRVAETLAELAECGDALHQALLARGMRDILGRS